MREDEGFCEDMDGVKYSYIVIKALDKANNWTMLEESEAIRHTSETLFMLWDRMQVEIRLS